MDNLSSRRGSLETMDTESSSDEMDIDNPIVVDDVYSEYEGLVGHSLSSTGTHRIDHSFSHSHYSGASSHSFSRSPVVISPVRGTSVLK